LENQVLQNKYETVAGQLAAAQAEAKAAEAKFRAASDTGDLGAMSETRWKLVCAEAKAVRLDEAKADLEVRRAEATALIANDPVEAVARTRAPRSADWIRRHPEMVLDHQKNMLLTGAHYSAVTEGHVPDSVPYFAFLEKKMGLDRDGASDRCTTERPAEKVMPDGASVHKLRAGEQAPEGAAHLSKREYELATDGTLTWNHGPNRGKPLGVAEYLRRRQAMSGPEWTRMD
jgi:hypothetical protein